MINVAINGFGRIGKTFLRVLFQDPKNLDKIKVGVINIGKGDIEAAAFAFKYDTIMGKFEGSVEFKNNKIIIDNYEIDVIKELDPENISWGKYNIDWVIESSGKFTKKSDAGKHIKSGAKYVLITAPAQDDDVTIIPGVNLELFNKNNHKIVSLGSCTTNAVAVMIKAINDKFSIEKAFMTTIHAYTNTQSLLDVDASIKDLRKGRAAALNIIPTSTGAMLLIDKIFDNLNGKIFGCSLRVPVATVSLIDLTVIVKDKVTTELVNNYLENISNSSLKNILGFSKEPLVSSDYTSDECSAIIDSLLTDAQGNSIKLFGWYDNEWGYSCRLRDFLLSI